MRTVHFILLMACLLNMKLSAQLENIAPVHCKIHDAGTLSGILLLTTRDNHSRYGAPNHYPSSLQIIDPLRPFPPIFFASAMLGIENAEQGGIYQDFRFQAAVRQLSFFFGISDKKSGTLSAYYISDTNFSIIDTFRGRKGYLTGHGFEINARGERLYFANEDTVLNISAFTRHAKDTAVLVAYQLIEILDKQDSLLFSWSPLDYLPISDTYANPHEISERNPLVTGWNWSRATSIGFTHEGNIVYSYRYIGVGKISRQTGKLLWKLGGKTPTIPLPENGEFYWQHDFRETASPDTYSVFSNGNEEIPCRVIIYHVNEKAAKADIVKIIQPEKPIFSTHGGNFAICEDGSYLINYGNTLSLDEWQKCFELFDSHGKKKAEYYLPCQNHSFQVHLVKTWRPAQPVILNDSGILKLSGISSSVGWYRLEGDRKAVYLSNGPALRPPSKGTYVAASQAGFGWLVSHPYVY